MLPLNFNFAQDVIDRLAGEDRAGLIFVDSYGHRRDYTFAEISDQSQRYAAVLRALGVEQGRRVVLCNSNSAKCLFLVLALARLGAVAVPCTEDTTADEIVERVLRTSTTTIVANRKRRALIEQVKDQLPQAMRYILVGEAYEGWARLDTLAQAAKPFAGITTQSLDMAMVFGENVLDYGALYEARTLAEQTLDPSASDRVWSAFPIGTHRWLTFVQAPWWRGASTVIHEGRFEPSERLELVRDLDVTILCQSADEYRAQLDLPELPDVRMPRLRRCIAGGAAPDAGLEARWRERTNLTLDMCEDVPRQ